MSIFWNLHSKAVLHYFDRRQQDMLKNDEKSLSVTGQDDRNQVLQLRVVINDGRVQLAGYSARGGVIIFAIGGFLVEQLRGRPVRTLKAVDHRAIVAELELGPLSLPQALLGEKLFRALIERIRKEEEIRSWKSH